MPSEGAGWGPGAKSESAGPIPRLEEEEEKEEEVMEEEEEEEEEREERQTKKKNNRIRVNILLLPRMKHYLRPTR